MTRFIALLRAVNVGKRQMAMAALRDVCTAICYAGVQTYVASGNLIFDADGTAASIEAQLAEAVGAHFGFVVEPIVRRASDWPAYLAANPFAARSAEAPNLVLMMLAQKSIKADAAETIAARAAHGERVIAAGGALWIDYAGGVARSKLSPAFIDKAVGSATTGRNIRTATRLAMLAGVA